MSCLNLLTLLLLIKQADLYQTVWNSHEGNRNVLSLSRPTLFQQYTSVIKAEFNHTYNVTINSTLQQIFEFKYEEKTNKTTAVRISTQLLSDSEPLSHFPLLLVVRQQEAIISWQLPLFLDYIYSFEHVSRTLCPMDLKHRKKLLGNQTFYVDVSTMYPKSNIEFSLRAYKCPVFDQNRDIKFQGKYQTMSKQAAITVVKEDYPEGSFYIVFVLKPLDLDCKGIQQIEPAGYERVKQLNVKVTGTISAKKYFIAIITAVVLFASFYFVAFLLGVFYHGCTKNKGIWMHAPQFLPAESPESGPTSPIIAYTNAPRSSYGAIPESEQTRSDKELRSVSRDTAHQSSLTATNLSDSIDSDEIDFLPDADSEKDVFRTKTAVFVCDLSRKKYKREHKKYTLYWRNLISIAIFYGLPVLQLVFTYQKVLNVTGDLDICYYNFNCAHPLGLVTSFNNVFSNIGYVLLGILFILLVWRRNIIYNKAVNRDKAFKKEYGIPQYFGLFYGMGLALVMEGIMSACYHVCPNYSNFQFDTSFMYIIACLCMLKIYQTRHTDISAKAHTSYLIMAFVIFIAVIGVVYRSSLFWIFFAVIDMTFYLCLSTHIYYMGRWSLDRGLCHRFCMMLRYDVCKRPMYLDRLVLLLIGTILNWFFAIYGAVNQPSDFASFLLGIFIGNLLLYCTFYIIMKIRSGEKIHCLAITCMVAAMVVWGFALYFFFQHITTWQETPAGSRENNRDCILLNFYDSHDVWHMLSAIALFLSFLVLLTIDDDVFSTRRDKIPVF